MVKMKNIFMILPKPNKIRVILIRFITKQKTTYNYHAVAHLPIVFFFPFFSPIFSLFFYKFFPNTSKESWGRTTSRTEKRLSQKTLVYVLLPTLASFLVLQGSREDFIKFQHKDFFVQWKKIEHLFQLTLCLRNRRVGSDIWNSNFEFWKFQISNELKTNSKMIFFIFRHIFLWFSKWSASRSSNTAKIWQ